MENTSAVTERVSAAPGQQPEGLLERFGEWVSGLPDTPSRGMVHRAPVVLWRLGLGRLIGIPLVLLTTRGRKSGLPRRVALAPHKLGDRLYLWCPYGDRAQWYRNVCAYPLVTIQSADGVHAARAVRMDSEAEAAAIYRMLKDFDAVMLRQYLERIGVADTPSSMAASMQRLHIFRIEPASEMTLPPQRADLLWVWPVAIGAAYAGWALARLVAFLAHNRAWTVRTGSAGVTGMGSACDGDVP